MKSSRKTNKVPNGAIGKLKEKIISRLSLSAFRRTNQWQRLGLVIITILGVFSLSILPGLAQRSVTVKVLIQAAEATQWQPLVEQFNEENDNITLEIVRGPTEANLVEDLYTSSFLLGDSPYDLAYMDIVWVPKFAAAGWLEDLSDRVSLEELKNTYLEADVDGGTYKDGFYRMPLRSDGGMLYYRTDLLNKGGFAPPATFQELIDISKQLKERGLTEWGYLWQGKQYEGLSAMFVEVLEGFGGFWIDPETNEVGLDKPEAINAVNFLRTTIEEGISPPGSTTYAEEETRRLFQNGNSVFLRNWPYVVSLAADSEIAGKYDIKPMVSVPGKDSASCLGGWGLGIVKSSKHKEEAWKVIEYFSNKQVQRDLISITGFVPARRSLFYNKILLQKYEYLPDLLEVIQNAVLRPPIPQYAQASDILQRYLSAAITRAKTPESAMKAAAAETRTLLGS